MFASLFKLKRSVSQEAGAEAPSASRAERNAGADGLSELENTGNQFVSQSGFQLKQSLSTPAKPKIDFSGRRFTLRPGVSVFLGLKFAITVAFFFILYFFAGETGGEWVYLLTAALLAVVALGVGLPLLQILDTKAGVYVPGESVAGEKMAIEVLISHATLKGVWCRIFPLRWLRLKVNMRGQDGKIADSIIRPAVVEMVSEAESVYIVSEPLKRGVYRFESLEAASCFPFNIVWWLTKVSATLLQKSLAKDNGELTVYPILMPLRGRFLQTLGASGDASGRLSERNRTSQLSSSVRSLRDYRAGDTPRWVHWKSYARTGKIMVKEFEAESSPHYFVAFDTQANWRTEEQFELAVCLANSIVHCQSAQINFDLLVPPSIFTKDVYEKPSSLQRSREILARVQADPEASVSETSSGPTDYFKRIEKAFSETLKQHPGGVLFNIVPGGSARTVNLVEASIDKNGHAISSNLRSVQRPRTVDYPGTLGAQNEQVARGKVIARISHLEQITMV